MADRPVRRAPARAPVVASAKPMPLEPIVAAASSALAPANYGDADAQRDLAWGYYRTNSKLSFAINWRASAMSRLSLIAAEVVPGEKEPVPLESGRAAEIVEDLRFAQSKILHDLSLQIDVPGRAYLVIRTDPRTKLLDARVYSTREVRLVTDKKKQVRGGPTYELNVGAKEWLSLADALVVLVRDQDPEWHYRDTSSVRSSFGILREIDLYDREIIAKLVSRIATNGLLFIPDEVTFPLREGMADNADPFMQTLMEAARQSIKDPGSASAAIPLMFQIPAEFIDKIHHLVLSEGIAPGTLEARDRAYSIFADGMNLPREMMTGLGDTNHWNASQITKEAVNSHIAPSADPMLADLTQGYLYPRLLAEKEPLVTPAGNRIIMWYDPSDLVLKPDRGAAYMEMHSRQVVSDEALRRETGASEEDKPTPEELRHQLLIQAAKEPSLTAAAIEELTGTPFGPEPAEPEQEEEPAPVAEDTDEEEEPEESTEPGTQDNEGPGQ